MRYISYDNKKVEASEIILGCMRIDSLEIREIEELIKTALEEGINVFDHADIYGDGRCEEMFSKAINMNGTIREKMILQSKCGIREGFYDYSKEHILNSVDGILKRLKTDYIDNLLLHRPDTLMDLEEVSEAFRILKESGKVRYFGVSNHNPMQIELLNKYLDDKIIKNQLQISITNTGIIDSGFNVNMKVNSSIDRDGSILEWCRLNNVLIEAWSPFQYGFFEGTFINSPKFEELNKKLEEIAYSKGVSSSAIAISWLLRHPGISATVLGTTNKNRLKDISKASSIELSRKEWYEIYLSAGNKLP